MPGPPGFAGPLGQPFLSRSDNEGPGPLTGSFIVDRDVIAGSDDAFERPGEPIEITGTGLISAHVGSRTALRCTDLPFQQGAEIVVFTVSATADNTDKVDAEGTWYAHAIDDAPTFTAVEEQIMDLPLTSASVPWNDNDLGVAGDRLTSPNLAAVVQEIVNRPGWEPGNAIALVYVHNSTVDVLSIASFEHATHPPPSFHGEYETIPIVEGVLAAHSGSTATLVGTIPPSIVAITPGSFTLNPVAVSPLSGGFETVTPGNFTLNPVAVTPTPGSVSVAATPGSLMLNPIAVTPVPGPSIVAATPGAFTLDPVAVTATPGPSIVAVTPGEYTLTPVAVTLAGALVVEIGQYTLTPVAVTPTPGPVTAALDPGSFTLAPVAVTPVPGPSIVALTPGDYTLVPVAAAVPSIVVATPGGYTLVPVALGLPAPPSTYVPPPVEITLIDPARTAVLVDPVLSAALMSPSAAVSVVDSSTAVGVGDEAVAVLASPANTATVTDTSHSIEVVED